MSAGTICVLSGDLARYATFQQSLVHLHVPEGTTVDFVMGYGIVEGLNTSTAAFLQRGGDWLWVMADDHAFDENLLLDLLARDLPIVAPLNVQRHMRFQPIIYAAAAEGGIPVHQLTWKHLAHKAGLYKLATRETCGSAGMLVRREVLERLEPPWWQDRPGQGYSEDLYFCERVRALGYEIYLDLDCRMGHSFPATAIPVQDDTGEWLVGLQVRGKTICYIRY